MFSGTEQHSSLMNNYKQTSQMRIQLHIMQLYSVFSCSTYLQQATYNVSCSTCNQFVAHFSEMLHQHHFYSSYAMTSLINTQLDNAFENVSQRSVHIHTHSWSSHLLSGSPGRHAACQNLPKCEPLIRNGSAITEQRKIRRICTLYPLQLCGL